MPLLHRLIPRIAGLTLLAATAGCAPDSRRDPFTASGEIIVMGGGDAGPESACFVCHGLKGEGDGQLTPRLAGLSQGYLQKQLQDYADGRRADPVMSPIAQRLSAEDHRQVSTYYAQLAPDLALVAVATPFGDDLAHSLYRAGDPRRGLLACAACHGADGAGVGPANPPLAGQPRAYLAEQLRRWRQSKRRNDPQDIMLKISQTLTPAELEALAQYASQLPPAAPPADVSPATSP